MTDQDDAITPFEREIRGRLIDLGRLPLERRVRVLQDGWKVMVQPELAQLTEDQAMAIVKQPDPPGAPPQADVFEVLIPGATAAWPGIKAS